jgi:DHA2 family multidrug resistance protein-like MFS transporter
MLSLCMLENGGPILAAALCGASGLVSLAALLRTQRNHPAPILAVDLLRIRSIRLSSLTSILAFATQSLALVSLPFYLQRAHALSPVITGLILSAWPLVVALTAAVLAPLSDRLRPGICCTIGLLVLAAGMGAMAVVPPQASVGYFVFLMGACGGGFGLFQAPNMHEIMSRAPASRSGGASGVVAVSRLVGQTSGAALVAECFHAASGNGPTLALWLGAIAALAGSVSSSMRLTDHQRSAM